MSHESHRWLSGLHMNGNMKILKKRLFYLSIFSFCFPLSKSLFRYLIMKMNEALFFSPIQLKLSHQYLLLQMASPHAVRTLCIQFLTCYHIFLCNHSNWYDGFAVIQKKIKRWYGIWRQQAWEWQHLRDKERKTKAQTEMDRDGCLQNSWCTNEKSTR